MGGGNKVDVKKKKRKAEANGPSLHKQGQKDLNRWLGEQKTERSKMQKRMRQARTS